MPTDPASPLLIAQRTHGNATEYVPTLIVLFLLVGALARLARAYGMITARTLAAFTI